MKPYVYWSCSEETKNNFGDALNRPLLACMGLGSIEHAGRAFSLRNPMRPILVGMGSILERAKFVERTSGRGVFFWGTGCKGKLEDGRHFRRAKVQSVRGPLTAEMLKKYGKKDVPDVYGDPALLVPHFWGRCGPNQDAGVLVIPHYKDYEFVKKLVASRPDLGSVYRVLDVRSPIDNVIGKVSTSRKIVSSSLHGLILADAYGIPNAWVSFGETLGGGGFKFDDHHLAFWGRRRQLYDVRTIEQMDVAVECVESPPGYDATAILNCFPSELLR